MLTTMQAAMELGIKPGSVKKLCQRGVLKAERIGRDWLISTEDLAQYKEVRRGKGRPKTISAALAAQEDETMKATELDVASLIHTISIERGDVGITRTMPGRWGFDTALLDEALKRDVQAFCEEFFHRPLVYGDTTTLMCPADLHQRVQRWQVADSLRNFTHALSNE